MFHRKLVFALGTYGILLNCCPIKAEPTAMTGPNFRFVLAPAGLTARTGYSLMGEAGENTVRINGTIGCQLDPNQRLKLSVDQLYQKLSYQFNSGKIHRWVNQIAGGGSYQYFLNDYLLDSIDIGGWYSNSRSRKLPPLLISSGETTSSTIFRNIAGAEAWHASLGTTILPWYGATFGLEATYDHVEYKTEAKSHQLVAGAGFTFNLNQRLCDELDLNIRGDWLKPYQHIGGSMQWKFPSSYGNVLVGIYGDYTHGTNGLPNCTSFGLQLIMAFGNSSYASPFYTTYCIKDKTRPRQDLLEWIADPAVLMPIVLSKADECNPPSSVVLPNVIVDLGPYSLDVSDAFIKGNCNAISYSAVGLPPDAAINETTGVITGVNLGLFTTPFNVNIFANCTCGNASSSFVLTYESLIP